MKVNIRIYKIKLVKELFKILSVTQIKKMNQYRRLLQKTLWLNGIHQNKENWMLTIRLILIQNLDQLIPIQRKDIK